MRIIFWVLLLQFAFSPAFAYYGGQGNQGEQQMEQRTSLKQINSNPNSNPNAPRITQNLQRKIDKSSQVNRGFGGYFSFDRKGYEAEKNANVPAKQSNQARRRFNFEDPTKYGSLKYQGSESYKKTADNASLNDTFKMNKYASFTYSNAIMAQLKSSQYAGGQNNTPMIANSSYGFGIGYGMQLFTDTQTNGAKQRKNSYKTINRRAIFGSKAGGRGKFGKNVNNSPLVMQNTRLGQQLEALKQKIRNLMGEDMLFAEFSGNIMFNEFKNNGVITNSVPLNKTFSGIYGSTKLIYMPKKLSANVTIFKTKVIPFQAYFFPEIGFGAFTYRNILDYNQNAVLPNGSSPKDEVISSNTTALIYGLGGGVVMDARQIFKTQRPVRIRFDIKYLTGPKVSASGGLSNRPSENLTYNSLSFNTSLIVAF